MGLRKRILVQEKQVVNTDKQLANDVDTLNMLACRLRVYLLSICSRAHFVPLLGQWAGSVHRIYWGNFTKEKTLMWMMKVTKAIKLKDDKTDIMSSTMLKCAIQREELESQMTRVPRACSHSRYFKCILSKSLECLSYSVHPRVYNILDCDKVWWTLNVQSYCCENIHFTPAYELFPNQQVERKERGTKTNQ